MKAKLILYSIVVENCFSHMTESAFIVAQFFKMKKKGNL
jgi:hypothetical protein